MDDDIKDWDEFAPCPDDEESEDAGACSGSPQGAAGTSSNVGNVGSNPMRRGGPGKFRSSILTWLRASYTDTCERLKSEMTKNRSGWPSCYDASHFVEDPPAPIFNTHQVQTSPSMFYLPRYFVWLPHLFHCIPCPLCKSARCMTHKGDIIYLQILSWPQMPRRVIDVDSHTYIIGHRYYCGDQRCGRTFQSWSQSILNVLPPSLASQFPFHLTYRSGLTDQLAALVWSSFGRGLGPTPFAEMIRTLHLHRFELSHVQYLQTVELLLPYVSSGFVAVHEPFSAWDDPDGYAGFVPANMYFRGFYDSLIERHSTQIDQKMAMNSLHKASIDHSHKVCRVLL
jgi:hypothetical protein